MSHFHSAFRATMFDSNLVQPIEGKNLIRIWGDGYVDNLSRGVWNLLKRQPRRVPAFSALPVML